ncbi:Cell division protein FtsW [hydrothermal vent metagenome]|uniref:peptidoglycan glycosyltransferase n=1 Tax=hydrothermal vent metagenome TaxID=652676 RepID=A0A3B0YAK4_9ZZZZ
MRDFSVRHRRLRQFSEDEDSSDGVLIFVIITLVLIGIVMVATASVSIGQKEYQQPFWFVTRHVIYLFVGIALSMVVLRIHSKVWYNKGPVLLIIAIILLALVWMPGLGFKANGSSRWLTFGLFNVQPSEIAKLCVLIYLAGYLLRHNEDTRETLAGFIRPLSVIMLVSALLLSEPDMGTTVILFASCMVVMFLAGARITVFAAMFGLIATLFICIAIFTPYMLDRLLLFWDPWQDANDKGYQLTNSLMAFGVGGLFGTGLGSSVQKLLWLPEPHTDFVFAILGEELGLVGTLAVIMLFAVLVWRIYHIAACALEKQMHFEAFLAYGIGTLIGLQAFINMGVNMGLLPTKGLTLPLMSYGGSSLVMTLISLAMILRIDYDVRHDEEHRAPRRRKK